MLTIQNALRKKWRRSNAMQNLALAIPVTHTDVRYWIIPSDSGNSPETRINRDFSNRLRTDFETAYKPLFFKNISITLFKLLNKRIIAKLSTHEIYTNNKLIRDS